MERYYDFVVKLADVFEEAKLDYAFTGALAVSFYGAPRTTADVDIMVTVSSRSDFASKIFSALKEAGLDVDERKIETALESGYKIATFRGKKTAFRVDIIFADGKLDKRPGKIDERSTFFQSPEGLIAAKLRMIKATLPPERSVKDKQDVKSILAFTKVDVAAVKKLAQKDNTIEIFDALTNE